MNGINPQSNELVQQMQRNSQQMMQYQFAIGQETARMQAESTSLNQMTKALNTAVQNIRA